MTSGIGLARPERFELRNPAVYAIGTTFQKR